MHSTVGAHLLVAFAAELGLVVPPGVPNTKQYMELALPMSDDVLSAQVVTRAQVQEVEVEDPWHPSRKNSQEVTTMTLSCLRITG